MGKLRDAEFCDLRLYHYKDMRLEWMPERIEERKKLKNKKRLLKNRRCKICGGLVIPPCVACYPEFYDNYTVFAVKIGTKQRKVFHSLISFAKARKKHG